MSTSTERTSAQPSPPRSEHSRYRSPPTARFWIATGGLLTTALAFSLLTPVTLAQSHLLAPPPMSDTPATDTESASQLEQQQIAKITRGLTNSDGGGIRVVATPGGSPAQALRLRVGDVITSINGHTVTSTDDFARIYREQGLPTHMTVQRDGHEIHVH